MADVGFLGRHPAELNQVWTNLIDNAVQAINGVGGEGTWTVRTALEHDRLLVEFQDTPASRCCSPLTVTVTGPDTVAGAAQEPS